MQLKPEFQFSQNNLQDYLDCPRRFQLRHVKKMAWPALETQPVVEYERQTRQGARFHELVYQHQSRLPAETLSESILDPELEAWWQAYLASSHLNLPAHRYPEFSMQTTLCGYRVVARFDLLAIVPGERFVIVDWKTARRRPTRLALAARVQTALYPFVLAASGACLNQGNPVLPEQIEMIYWFPQFPDQPERFAYSQVQLDTTCRDLGELIQEVLACAEDAVSMAHDEKNCRYCCYRSLCERGQMVGDLGDWDEAGEVESDLSYFDVSFGVEISF